MINLTSLLLLTLLSFTLQIEHCKEALYMCQSQVTQYQNANTPKTAIPNCLSYYENKCDMCKKGFALSNDMSSCVSTSIDNCYQLANGNANCQDCYPGYYVKENKCVKLLLAYCVDGSENDCSECVRYAEPKYDENYTITACEPINIINGCDGYNKQRTKCETCDDGYSLSTDGSSCTFKGCGKENSVEYCETCELGYYTNIATGKCVKIGETDADSQDSSFMNKVGYFFLLSTFILLI